MAHTIFIYDIDIINAYSMFNATLVCDYIFKYNILYIYMMY